MTKWEYKIEYICHRGSDEKSYKPGDDGKYLWQFDIEKTLNALGADGWELIYFPDEMLGCALSNTVDGYAMFKRPKG